jgi:hypothetical protein
MTHKLIKIANYLLVVDDSEIKEGDYTFQEASNLISKYNNAYSKKIIAHLPLNNSPILEGVDLLPPLETVAERLALQEVGGWVENESDHYVYSGFVSGYNKAKEKYKYTEDDMMKMYKLGSDRGATYQKLIFFEPNFHAESAELCNTLLQTTQQPKTPVGFKREMFGYVNPEWNEFPKTITNSQGITQWVGVYEY